MAPFRGHKLEILEIKECAPGTLPRAVAVGAIQERVKKPAPKWRALSYLTRTPLGLFEARLPRARPLEVRRAVGCRSRSIVRSAV